VRLRVKRRHWFVVVLTHCCFHSTIFVALHLTPSTSLLTKFTRPKHSVYRQQKTYPNTTRHCLLFTSLFTKTFQLIPCTYFRNDIYSEPIQTVNAMVVGVYTHHARSPKQRPKRNDTFFVHTLGRTDNEKGGDYYSVAENGGNCGTWDQEVYNVKEGQLR